MKKIFLSIVIIAGLMLIAGCETKYEYPFQNPNLPVDERVDNLISLLTLEEKAELMVNSSQPVERLGIPAYDWWNEALHGIGRAGLATVYPQAIGMAASSEIIVKASRCPGSFHVAAMPIEIGRAHV